MSQNIRFILDNVLRRCSVTPSAPTATPWQNVLQTGRSRVLRLTDLSQPTVLRGVLDQAQKISGFAFVRHNLSASGQTRLRLYDTDDANAAVLYDSGAQYPVSIKPLGQYVWGVDPWGAAPDFGLDAVFSHFFEPVTAGVFEWEISDPYHPDGYLDIGMAWLGEAVTLDYNYSYGNTIRWQNAQDTVRTEGGSLHTIGPRHSFRQVSLPFEHLTENDRERLSRQQREHPGQPVFIHARPGGTALQQREFALGAQWATPTFGETIPPHASALEHPDYDPDKQPDGQGGWAIKPEPQREPTVSARRFTHELLGMAVYGGLLTARDGLRAKFAANQASEQEIQQLTLLNAADRLVMQGDIDLDDPAVAQVLDFAVANPYIAFTEGDKVRVLNNQQR